MVENYRTVSILCALFFEKLLTENFITAYKGNYMIRTWFQDKKHQAITQMLQYSGKTAHCFNAKKSAISVHLFIAKPFDTINHKAIFCRLEKNGFD